MTSNVNEGTHEITTFLNANSSSKNKKSTPGDSVKTIFNRIIPSSSTKSNVAFLFNDEDDGKNSLNDVFDLGVDGSLMTNMQTFRTLSASRYRQYATYDQMAEDSVISSALDLYADDSTIPNSQHQRIWIEADDSNDEEIVQNLLDATELADDIWSIARDLALYGDVYYELFYEPIDSGNSGSKLIESKINSKLDYTTNLFEVDSLKLKKTNGYILSRIERVVDVENIFDLTIGGKTVAYARACEEYVNTSTLGYVSPKTGASDIKYYPPDKFVHFCIKQGGRNQEQFLVDIGGGKQVIFNIKRGKSMIHDTFKVNRDLQLLEYSILLNRVSRSSILRILQVEVGNMSKGNIQNTLRRIKNLVEQKQMMNTDTGEYKPYNNPGPIENYIYVPVHEGKGAITQQVFGGDVNIRDIADIDYYSNKQFASLKIPKAFLGFEDSLPGMGGGSTLTKQDARYSRTISREQGFICAGVTDLLDIFLKNRGLSRILGTYTVCMNTPSSLEDEERSEQFSNKMELVKSFMEIIDSFAQSESVDVNFKKLIEYIADNVLVESEVKDILVAKKAVSSGDLGSISGGPVESDDGMGSFSDTSDTNDELGLNTSENEPPQEPETSSTDELTGLGGEWNDLEV